MAGRSSGKPYAVAIQKAPQFEKALRALPKHHVAVLNSFLKENTNEDDFQEMVMICYAVWQENRNNKDTLAKQRIKSFFSSRSKEYFSLYHNSISFDQCIGDSTRPVSDWLNPLKEEETWY